MAEEDEEELLVLELDSSRWFLLRERARSLIPGGDGKRANTHLSFSLRVGARFETWVEVVLALYNRMAEVPTILGIRSVVLCLAQCPCDAARAVASNLWVSHVHPLHYFPDFPIIVFSFMRQ